MKKALLVCLLGMIIGAVIGAVGMFLVYPFIFPPPVVNEQVLDINSKQVIASGVFIHPDPSDPVHWGKGGTSIYQAGQSEIFLEPDFEVGPGPNYYVYLAAARDIRDNAAFEASERVQVGRLKSFEGSQVYALDAGTSIRDYHSVVIWCETFNQLITSATLSYP